MWGRKWETHDLLNGFQGLTILRSKGLEWCKGLQIFVNDVFVRPLTLLAPKTSGSFRARSPRNIYHMIWGPVCPSTWGPRDKYSAKLCAQHMGSILQFPHLQTLPCHGDTRIHPLSTQREIQIVTVYSNYILVPNLTHDPTKLINQGHEPI